MGTQDGLNLHVLLVGGPGKGWASMAKFFSREKQHGRTLCFLPAQGEKSACQMNPRSMLILVCILQLGSLRPSLVLKEEGGGTMALLRRNGTFSRGHGSGQQKGAARPVRCWRGDCPNSMWSIKSCGMPRMLAPWETTPSCLFSRSPSGPSW